MLLVVEAHSKWIEAQPMATTTAKVTIEQLRVMLVRWGIPESAVSDNGPQFVAHEYEEFCKLNGIRSSGCHVSPLIKWPGGASCETCQTGN